MNRNRQRKYIWIILLLIAVWAIWHFAHGGSEDSEKSSDGKHGGKNAAVPVEIATARTGDIPVYLEGLGNITPRSIVTVHTLINGELMEVLFKEGQMVKKNDLLAHVDDRPYLATLEQAEGLLKRDQALLAEAKLDLARYQALWKQDSIAKQQLDTQASLVKQYEGAIGNDQGQVDAAKTNLVYTNITAPVTGRVGLRQVDAGNIVHTTDTNGLVVVTELQPITSIFTIPEDSIPAVSKHIGAGDELVAEAWSRDNKTKLAVGTLTAIDNQVDPSTGMVKFRAEFANGDNSLFPSQFVNVHLKLDTLKNVVIIPTAAVQRGTKGTFVYLAKDDNTVAMQNVTLGPGEGEGVSVSEGVKAGDKLVVDGTDSLRDGAKIKIANDGAAASDTADKESKDSMADSSESKHHRHKKDSDNADKDKAE